ncbi:transposable element Tc1 transposase [Trichonephila clavipes]|nr:transposable element Tc1 transposase [Trichonephila clavipes]
MPLRRFRRPNRQLNGCEHSHIDGMYEAGWSYRAIERHLQRTVTAVQRCYKSGCSTRGLLATDHVILNHGQVTWTTPELAPPSEHDWNMVGCQIRSPQNIANLEQLVNVWQNVSQDDIRNLYHSLPRRIQACIAARGSSTNY